MFTLVSQSMWFSSFLAETMDSTEEKKRKVPAMPATLKGKKNKQFHRVEDQPSE